MKNSNLYSPLSSPNTFCHQGDEYLKTNAKEAISYGSDYFHFFPYENDLHLEYIDFVYECGSSNCLHLASKSYFNSAENTITYSRNSVAYNEEKWTIKNGLLSNASNEVHLDFYEINEFSNDVVKIYESNTDELSTEIHQYRSPETCPKAEKFETVECIKTLEIKRWATGAYMKTARYYGRNLGLIYEEKRHHFADDTLGCVESRTLEQVS